MVQRGVAAYFRSPFRFSLSVTPFSRMSELAFSRRHRGLCVVHRVSRRAGVRYISQYRRACKREREEEQMETCTSIDHASHRRQDIAIDRTIPRSEREKERPTSVLYRKIIHLAFKKNLRRNVEPLSYTIIHVRSGAYENRSAFHFETADDRLFLSLARSHRAPSQLSRDLVFQRTGARLVLVVTIRYPAASCRPPTIDGS